MEGSSCASKSILTALNELWSFIYASIESLPTRLRSTYIFPFRNREKADYNQLTKFHISAMPTKLIRKQFLLTDEENSRLEVEARNAGLSVSNLTRKRHGLKLLTSGGKRNKEVPATDDSFGPEPK